MHSLKNIFLFALVLTVASLVSACKSAPEEEEAAEEEAATQGEQDRVEPSSGGTATIAPWEPQEIPALEALPPSTYTVIGGRSIETFALWLGSDEVLKRRDWLAFPFTSRQIYMAFNVLDIYQLQRYGIDTEAPAGIAALDSTWMTFAAFGQLSNPKLFREKFEDFVTGEMSGTLEEATVNGWTVLEVDNLQVNTGRLARFHVLLQDRTVICLISGISHHETGYWADFITRGDPKISIRHQAGFKNGVDRLSNKKDAFVYVNIAALTGEYLVGFEEVQKTGEDEQRQSAAQRNPDSMAANAQSGNVKVPIFRQGTQYAELMAMMLPFDGVAMGAELQEDGVDFQLEVIARDEALPGRLLDNGIGKPLVVQAHSTPPLFLFHAQTDPETARSLLEGLLGPGSIRHANRITQKWLNRGLDDGLLPLLDGEVALALSGDIEEMPLEALDSPSIAADHLRFLAVLGLSKPDEARKVIEEAISSPMTRLLVKWDSARGVLSIPVIGITTITVAVHDRYLLIGNDGPQIDRVVDGNMKSFTASDALDSDVASLLDRDGLAGATFLDLKLLALLAPVTRQRSGFSFYGFGSEAMLNRSLPLHQLPDDAEPALKKLASDYETKRQEILDIGKKMDRDWVDLHLDVMGQFGLFAASGGFGKNGLQLQGNWSLRADSVETMLDDVVPKLVNHVKDFRDQHLERVRLFEEAALMELRLREHAVP